MSAPPNAPVITKRPRLHRQPLSSSEEVQNSLDELLHKAGARALRSNSLFATSDYEGAADYAENHDQTSSDVFAIFPVGNFHYTWFDGSHDLYQTLMMEPELRQMILANDAAVLGRTGLSVHIDDGTLNAALRSRNEIMIHAESFLCVRDEWAKKLSLTSL